MINYATSPMAALAASTAGPGGGPGPFVNPADIFKTREALSGIVGKGFTNFQDSSAKANYANLVAMHGPAVAQKLVMHAMLFNQRPDMAGKSPEQRIQSFYDMGSADPATQNILSRSAQMGAGPVADTYNSWDRLNQEITGRSADTRATPSPDALKAAAAKLK